MSSIHSTGSTGSHSNVYRLGDSTAPLKSRKRRNRFRTFLEKFCAATPATRIKINKILLAEKKPDATGFTNPARHSRSHAAFLLKNDISRSLWTRYEQAQYEAWCLDRQEDAP
jgi:hypothetical protein